MFKAVLFICITVWAVMPIKGQTVKEILEPPYESGRFPDAIAITDDLDGDNTRDFIIAGNNDIHKYSGATKSVFSRVGFVDIRRISTGGDVNSDGIQDLIVVGKAMGSETDFAFVLSGDRGILHRLNVDNTTIWGSRALIIPDINEDDHADILIASSQDGNGGDDLKVDVYSGMDGAELISTLVELASTASTLTIPAISVLDDLNDDGIPEFIVGAENADTRAGQSSGRVVVLNGSDFTIRYVIESPAPTNNGLFGARIATLGDINDDGSRDFVVGAFSDSPDGGFGRGPGMAHVFSGVDGAVLYSVMSPEPGVNSSNDQGLFGVEVANVGDVNGDAITDFAVGATRENQGRGRVYVFSGAQGELLAKLESPNPFSATDPRDAGQFGSPLVGADLDGNGSVEIIVGATCEREQMTIFRSCQGTELTGNAYVFELSNTSTHMERQLQVSKSSLSFQVYPNPFFGEITAYFELNEGKEINLSLFNILGQQVHSFPESIYSAGSQHVDLQLYKLALPRGVYFLRAQSGSITTTKKIIKR